MFKFLRIAILLFVLIAVWTSVKIQQNVHHGWTGTLDIRIIPVIADADPATLRFAGNITEESFSSVVPYLVDQGARHGKDLDYAFSVKVEAPIQEVPPSPSAERSVLSVMWWSLKLKWWSWRNQLPDHSDSQIRLYVLYKSINKDALLPHSTGLQNGLIGIIHARAEAPYRRIQQLIVVHELLHILGATDKYDLASGQPLYPDGYANPDKQPLHPQKIAEIMARSKPLSQSRHEVATRLQQTMIGDLTATQIGWR